LQALARNIGAAIGISVTTFTLERSAQAMHADIAAGITPFDRVLQGNDTVQHMLDPATRHGAALLDQMVTHQAQIIAYNNDFRMMMLTFAANLERCMAAWPAELPPPTTKTSQSRKAAASVIAAP